MALGVSSLMVTAGSADEAGTHGGRDVEPLQPPYRQDGRDQRQYQRSGNDGEVGRRRIETDVKPGLSHPGDQRCSEQQAGRHRQERGDRGLKHRLDGDNRRQGSPAVSHRTQGGELVATVEEGERQARDQEEDADRKTDGEHRVDEPRQLGNQLVDGLLYLRL